MADLTMHELAMQIRYDLTAAQGKLTELVRQIAELPDAASGGSRTERALSQARTQIEGGAWDVLDPVMLDVELDLLGIPHCDRPHLERLLGQRRHKPTHGEVWGENRAGATKATTPSGSDELPRIMGLTPRRGDG